jgi:hypothetical protein
MKIYYYYWIGIVAITVAFVLLGWGIGPLVKKTCGITCCRVISISLGVGVFIDGIIMLRWSRRLWEAQEKKIAREERRDNRNTV